MRSRAAAVHGMCTNAPVAAVNGSHSISCLLALTCTEATSLVAVGAACTAMHPAPTKLAVPDSVVWRSKWTAGDSRAAPATDVDQAFSLEQCDGPVDGTGGNSVLGCQLHDGRQLITW